MDKQTLKKHPVRLRRQISEEVLRYPSRKFHFSTFIPQFPRSPSVLVLPFTSVACVMKEAQNVVITACTVGAVGQKMRALMFWAPVHLCALSSLETSPEILKSFSWESPRNQNTSGVGIQHELNKFKQKLHQQVEDPDLLGSEARQSEKMEKVCIFGDQQLSTKI